MSITYRFESEILVVETVGECSTAEIADVVENSINDPDFPEKASLLIYLKSTQQIYHGTKTERDAMARFVSLLKRFNNRMAFVAASDLAFGLLRMGGVASEYKGIEVMIFRKFDSAREWLLS